MSSVWGNKLSVSLFGESHGEVIGAVINGVPAGILIDQAFIQEKLDRRAAKGKELATPRKEGDRIKIVSGVFKGRSTGSPLTGMIVNENTKSSDYEKTKALMRPGHADYTANRRYHGFADYRGGGHFSARLTAPYVFAGAIAQLILKDLAPDLKIASRIRAINTVEDVAFLKTSDYESLAEKMTNPNFPLFTQSLEGEMKAKIAQARAEKDSIGGIIEGFAVNVPPGLGDPFFDSVESSLAGLLFSIPAVKGVSFGLGFDFLQKKGSQVNDPFVIEDGRVRTKTNYNGGINGGISNGMPIIVQVVLKPTPSIGKKQETINLETMEETKIEIDGRHDPCVVLRAFPIIEAAMALGLAEHMLGGKNGKIATGN